MTESSENGHPAAPKLGKSPFFNWRSYIPIKSIRHPPPVVAVLNLHGAIGLPSGVRRGLSLATVAPVIERVFETKHLHAAAVVVNSPGGSPVQSHLIFKRILDLAREKDVPVFTFVEDAAASGGYWLALAGDEIYADESSIIGSIGVVSASFGFTAMIRKLGVDRRIHTSGSRKAMLDPFRAENRDDVDHLKDIQVEVHEAFIRAVRDRRGDRLKDHNNDLFSGAFWTGHGALERGLIDGFGELRQVMRDRFGVNVRFRSVEMRRNWRQRLGLGSTSMIPEDWADSLISSIEEKAAWTRIGL